MKSIRSEKDLIREFLKIEDDPIHITFWNADVKDLPQLYFDRLLVEILEKLLKSRGVKESGILFCPYCGIHGRMKLDRIGTDSYHKTCQKCGWGMSGQLFQVPIKAHLSPNI